MIILFLAILHLLKERIINVEQGSQFEDMVISSGGLARAGTAEGGSAFGGQKSND